MQHQRVLHVIVVLKVCVILKVCVLCNKCNNYTLIDDIHYIIGLSAPVSAGITLAISIPMTSIVSSLLTLLVVYLCCGKSKGNYSINTTSPVYETPLPGSNITRASEFEMKGNQAYGHVTSAPRYTSEYETVTS